MYQELFALTQALPGPASTKMLYCINLVHGGFASALLVILLWRCVHYLFRFQHQTDQDYSLPGALGMYGLALGIGRIGERLPDPVYALLSGLNAATVGIIALAAVQLSEKAITDRLTRILVFVGGTAGMLYTALWYFPLLMVAGGSVAVVWDKGWLQRAWKRMRGEKRDEEMAEDPPILLDDLLSKGADTPSIGIDQPQKAYLRRPAEMASDAPSDTTPAKAVAEAPAAGGKALAQQPHLAPLSWKAGLGIVAFFAASFITIITVRAKLSNPTRPFSLFANMYLAGTIIFGGGARQLSVAALEMLNRYV